MTTPAAAPVVPSGDVVVDASALLCLTFAEKGADAVEDALPGAVTTPVTLAEVVEVLARRGVLDPVALADDILALGLAVEPVAVGDHALSHRVSGLDDDRRRRTGDKRRLALGDRCLLAVALRLQLPVLTADRAWADLDMPVPVHLVR